MTTNKTEERRITIEERNERFYLTDNGVETEVTDLAKPDKKTGELWIKLPENSANRQWCSVKQLRKLGGKKVYEYKESRTGTTTRKTDRDYLSEEDQTMLDALLAKAKAAKEAAKKQPMTEEEKLRAKIARDQAKLDELIAKRDQVSE